MGSILDELQNAQGKAKMAAHHGRTRVLVSSWGIVIRDVLLVLVF
jgi:hypothetical protein